MPDMASSGPGSTELTISNCATRCHESFQQCLVKAASIHARELALIENQFAKFSLWTAYFQVFGSGRDSLDHRLRESFDVQDAIIGVVEALNYSVLKCTSILEASTPVPLDFNSALQDITKQIALLHKFSGIIRRVGRETQDLTDITDFKIKDNRGNDLEPVLKEDFARHIRNQFPRVSDTIQQRLVNTMILRHKKVLHRRFCCGKFPDRTLKPSDTVEVATPSGFSAFGSVAIGDYGDIPFPPAPCGTIMQKYDLLKKQRREECNLNQETENSDPERAKKYEEILEKDWNEILEAAGEIYCPFCCLSLPAGDVVDESKWKLHVKNDLDSYVCLFEGCESPEEVYSHSSTWLKHMSSHYMRWRCVSKSHAEFQSITKSEYVDHMKVVHPGKFTDAQLNILAIRNARPAITMFKPCPLCGKKEFDGNRADHVAGHLLLLALKSLPSYDEHIVEQKELVYQQPHIPMSNTHSKSTIRQDSRNDSNFIVHVARTQSSFIPKKEGTAMHRSARIPPVNKQHQRNDATAQELQRWQKPFNSQQDSFINTMDDVEFRQLSSAKHASQNHLEAMDKDEEKKGDGEKDRNTATKEINDDVIWTTSYHEHALGQEALQQGNAEASPNFRGPGRTLNIDMAPQEYLREMERERDNMVRPISSFAYVDAGLALRSADNTDYTSIMSQHPAISGSIPTAMTSDSSIISNSVPSISGLMARENSFVPMVESQDFGGVAQCLRMWTDSYEKRNAYTLTDSFYWDDTRLISKGIPLLDREHIAPAEGSPSSMNMNNFVQIMDNSNATEAHNQWPLKALLAMNRRNNDLGKLSQQQFTARANLVIKSDRDSISLDETLHSSDADNYGHIARMDDRLPSTTVKSILEEMSKELDALYRRITMESDTSNHMFGILDSADENISSLSTWADADMLQQHSPSASDKHRLFMCPYAMRYPDRVNHSCFQRLNTIPYLKQHLRQSHHDTTNCPHQCQSRRPETTSRRSQLHAPLCFDSNVCLQINKERSDRSKTYRQQWERIYQVLYPEADRIPDPYIGELAVKRLRSIFQFMENHGLKYLTSIYPPKLVDPDAEVMYQTAFCKWLPLVFEWRFPPQGQQLLGDFLNQINSALCGNYYRLAYPSGASRQDVLHFSSASQTGQHDTFYNTVSQYGTMFSHHPPRHTDSSTLPPQQQIPSRSSMEGSLHRTHYDSSSDMPSYTNTVQLHENMDSVTLIRDERLSEGQHNIHHFLFAPRNSMQGSRSHFAAEPPVNMEGIETSQMGTWKSPF
ncbi:hypothetical protein N5P37_002401 [Trichoderma harzianum]|nr:hypothetical protein N5P37_002401 [Trichoderma harzianum]